MVEIIKRFVPAHAVLVDRREISRAETQDYFDRVYTEATQTLRAAKVRQVGPPRCYYFEVSEDAVDLAGGYPVRMDTVNKLGEKIPDSSPFKVVRHGDLRTAHLRFQGQPDGLSAAWEELAAYVRESDSNFGGISWEEFVNMEPAADGSITVDLHWALS